MDKEPDMKKMKLDLSPENAIIEAVKNEDSKMVYLLLKKGAKVNCVSTGELKNNYTPLHFAVEKGNKEIVDLLLEYDANASVQGENNITPLHIAAKRGDELIAENLLNHNADIHFVTLDEGYTPLHFASEIGCLDVVRLLLNKGADINCSSTKDNFTPLHIATQKGYNSVVRLLLQHGALVDNQDKNGKTALIYALSYGVSWTIKNCEYSRTSYMERTIQNGSDNTVKGMVEILLEYNADVNLGDIGGFTPLHISAKNGNEEVTKMLLEKKANVNAVSKNGTTVMQNAIQCGGPEIEMDEHECPMSVSPNQKVISTLLYFGAQINPTDDQGRTALYIAAECGNSNIVKSIMQYHVDVNVADRNGDTPLHVSAKNGHAGVTTTLINNGANMNAVNKNGITVVQNAIQSGCAGVLETLLYYEAEIDYKAIPWHLSAKIGDTEVVETLLRFNADINLTDEQGRTALFIAAECGNIEIIEVLLEHNANVNLGDRNGDTPLHISAKSGNKNVTNMLIKNGANVNAKNKNMIAVLQNAIQSDHVDVAKLLIEGGANVDYKTFPWHLSAKIGDTEVVETLLRFNADINSKDEQGRTALFIAAECGNTEIIEVLLEYNADVNLGIKSGVTPLHLCADIGIEKLFPMPREFIRTNPIRGNKKIAEMFIKKGANVNATTINGYTPLHYAIQNGHVVIAKLLIDCEAKIDYKTNDGMTPLHLSASKGYKEIVETLLKLGADINSTDQDGRTALHIASWGRHQETISCLLEYGANVNHTCIYGTTPYCYESERGQGIYTLRSNAIPNCCFTRLESECMRMRRKNDGAPEIILPHLIKMKAASLNLCERNLTAVDNCFRFNNFEIKCQNEVARMKCEKIKNTNISFYDILTKDAISLAKLMRNENILQSLKAEGFKTKFPIYASMLMCQFRKGVTRNEKIERANNILFHQLPELPDNCIDEILNQLSIKDLGNLIDASKSGDLKEMEF